MRKKLDKKFEEKSGDRDYLQPRRCAWRILFQSVLSEKRRLLFSPQDTYPGFPSAPLMAFWRGCRYRGQRLTVFLSNALLKYLPAGNKDDRDKKQVCSRFLLLSAAFDYTQYVTLFMCWFAHKEGFRTSKVAILEILGPVKKTRPEIDSIKRTRGAPHPKWLFVNIFYSQNLTMMYQSRLEFSLQLIPSLP